MCLAKTTTQTLTIFIYNNLIFFRFGGTTFYSYVAAPIAFKVLEKEQFSALQNKIFPYFFQMQAASPVILALTAPIALTAAPLTSLVVASVSGLTNLFWLLPWTHRVKELRKDVAKKYTGDELEAKDSVLRKEFGKSHGLSLLFNLSNVCGMLAYGVCLSRGLLRKIPK
ncbi:hypothetical protein SEUBUCD646_0P03660 [Saccharomyces eubayanus]|uniref:TMEM205-like domain-containing protein n=1 Tax=Saccharomyces eubayanus TaxID=1080349 RepID=A0ABN8VPY9_SACEU|nr:hypothetical protein SEUBUCD650_0P03670 [Saccharomyces eubayanus]CAI1815413.1 hypothetical protein SEUBUCD646_0P03660 [Saccharomyces eubayanus]